MKYNNILLKYLEIFSKEKNKQKIFKEYLKRFSENEVIDWNNFDGHIVASGFVYAIKEKKFLVLLHKDINMFLYPGGHIETNDKDVLQAAIREIKEETGLTELNQIIIGNDKIIPFDIDSHKISYNKRLNLPEHYHFDFRYFFTIDKIENIKIDKKEHSSYKWIDLSELARDKNFKVIILKIKKVIKEKQLENKSK